MFWESRLWAIEIILGKMPVVPFATLGLFLFTNTICFLAHPATADHLQVMAARCGLWILGLLGGSDICFKLRVGWWCVVHQREMLCDFAAPQSTTMFRECCLFLFDVQFWFHMACQIVLILYKTWYEWEYLMRPGQVTLGRYRGWIAIVSEGWEPKWGCGHCQVCLIFFAEMACSALLHWQRLWL